MDISRFKEVVSAFLDSSDNLQIEKGTMILQFGLELINAELTTHDGSLFVRESGREVIAEKWIVRRMAALDLLAERIAGTVKETTFVTAQGTFLDEVERSTNDEPINVQNALEAVRSFLARRPGGTCSVLYLTSDAGEGKTTLISELAKIQAELFRNSKTDWLLVPIGLGGRPFLRFDDVIVAALMNQLRFQRLYFEAFIQLVRMGYLVPALDGFEEIFVETATGDAVSSLGTLMYQLKGEGSILIAARRAYFEFKSLQTQARLLDALPDVDLGFGRVSLKRWGKDEFVKYCRLNDVSDANAFYDSVAVRVSENHPLLTRAILVKRLVELEKQSPDHSFLESLRPEASAFFGSLVDKLLEREATEKWIDKFGDPPTRLLSVAEHKELLGLVAEEMWISKTALLNVDMLDSLAEIFCETKGFSPVITRQVKERLKQHALVVTTGHGRREFGFDHSHFKDFFLGLRLAEYLRESAEVDIRKLFRVDVLPDVALESATHEWTEEKRNVSDLIRLVSTVTWGESSSAFIRENAGAVVARLLETAPVNSLDVVGLMFPVDSLKGRSINKIKFKGCYFRPTELAHCRFVECQFLDCEFEHLGITPDAIDVQSTAVSSDTRIHSVTVTHNGEVSDYFNPDAIRNWLSRIGFDFQNKRLPLGAQEVSPVVMDGDLKMTQHLLQMFHRSTLVSHATLEQRFYNNSERFTQRILPELLQSGVLEESRRTSSGTRYKLGVSLISVAEALRQCKGSFSDFITLVRAGRR